MTPETREATSDDAERISALMMEVSAAYIFPDLSDEGRRALQKTMLPSTLRKYIASNHRYHIAEINGQLVGAVGLMNNKHIYHLFVRGDCQRQGIATCLWGLALTSCLQAGNRGRFTVRSSLYARDFYERMGFRAKSAPIFEHGIPCIPMALDLDSQQ